MRVLPSERAEVEEVAIAGCCGEGSGDGDGAGVEEDGAVASGSGDGGGVGASSPGVVAELPAADSASRSVGLVGFRWGVRGHGEPWRACVPRGPHLSIYGAARTGAHQPWYGWAPPIRARGGAGLGRWTESEIELTISSSISSFLYIHFSTNQCTTHAPSYQLKTL